MFKGVEFF